ncbi:hypothetical protein ACK8OR_03660 [Jannaschia sp. KMU-145]|uniref:hypothetical protein n=1 Tax=Jannaschia halovivens TaxID=3388667 RepID=UPI00396B362C
MGEIATEYQDCLVTFIDILGFRELLATQPASQIAEHLQLFRRVSGVKNGQRQGTDTEHKSATRIETISDAIVRIVPDQEHDSYTGSRIYDEVLSLVEIQIECLQRGLLVRGATAFGSVHIPRGHEGPIFGPALVEAFEMESREVVYPRVAIHADVIARNRKSADPHLVESFEHDNFMLEVLLSRDGLGLYYVDYLKVVSDNRYSGDVEMVGFLSQHKALIERGLSMPSGAVRRKYNWLCDYHNASIGNIINHSWDYRWDLPPAEGKGLLIEM